MSQIPIGWLIHRGACVAHSQQVMMIDVLHCYTSHRPKAIFTAHCCQAGGLQLGIQNQKCLGSLQYPKNRRLKKSQSWLQITSQNARAANSSQVVLHPRIKVHLWKKWFITNMVYPSISELVVYSPERVGWKASLQIVAGFSHLVLSCPALGMTIPHYYQ